MSWKIVFVIHFNRILHTFMLHIWVSTCLLHCGHNRNNVKKLFPIPLGFLWYRVPKIELNLKVKLDLSGRTEGRIQPNITNKTE